jgi:hypothetical protein
MDVQAVSEQVPGRHKSYNIQIIYEVAGRSATQNCKLHMFNKHKFNLLGNASSSINKEKT